MADLIEAREPMAKISPEYELSELGHTDKAFLAKIEREVDSDEQESGPQVKL